MVVRAHLRQVVEATCFLSRLPLPQRAPSGPLPATLRAAPWAGMPIAAGPALLLFLACRFGLTSLAASALAVTALIAVTGALHEDGLADVADGFGGGATVARKLAIMRDSRVGTFGAVAVAASLLLRVAALQGVVERAGAGPGALALMAAACVSRGLMLVPLALLPPARPDGLGRAAMTEGQPLLMPALGAAALLGFALAWPAVPDALSILGDFALSAAAALGMTRLARQHVKGVTGDVIGATQQVVEIAVLLALSAGAGSR